MIIPIIIWPKCVTEIPSKPLETVTAHEKEPYRVSFQASTYFLVILRRNDGIGCRRLRVVHNLQPVAFPEGQVAHCPRLVVVQRHKCSDASCKKSRNAYLNKCDWRLNKRTECFCLKALNDFFYLDLVVSVNNNHLSVFNRNFNTQTVSGSSFLEDIDTISYFLYLSRILYL